MNLCTDTRSNRPGFCGTGTVIGTMVGGFVMAVLNNGVSILGVSVDWQQSPGSLQR